MARFVTGTGAPLCFRQKFKYVRLKVWTFPVPFFDQGHGIIPKSFLCFYTGRSKVLSIVRARCCMMAVWHHSPSYGHISELKPTYMIHFLWFHIDHIYQSWDFIPSFLWFIWQSCTVISYVGGHWVTALLLLSNVTASLSNSNVTGYCLQAKLLGNQATVELHKTLE